MTNTTYVCVMCKLWDNLFHLHLMWISLVPEESVPQNTTTQMETGEYCCSPIISKSEASSSSSRFHSFTASIRGWEQMILNTLLGSGVVVHNDDSDEDDITGMA